jgi:SAM-dependent methyltransferase
VNLRPPWKRLRERRERRRLASEGPDFERRVSALVAGFFDEGWAVRERAFFDLRDRLRDDHDSIFYAFKVYRRFFSAYRRLAGRDEAPGAVLELGPGRNLAIGVLAVASGTERYAGGDLNPKLRGRPDWFYRRLVKEIQADPGLLVATERERERAPRRAEELLPGEGRAAGAEIGPGKIEHVCPCDASALPFADGSFDFVFSNAVFEHFYDPAAALGEVRRVLRPGGISLHKVDMRYHRDQSKPLSHLAFPDAEWEARKAKHGWTNRGRRGDYLDAAREAGLEALEDSVTSRAEITPALRARLQPRFRAMTEEQLAPLGILMAHRVPGGASGA